MNALQVGQVIVSNIHADTEVQTSVASVDDLEVPELQCRGTHEITRCSYSLHILAL